jgi:hypothetical protein
VSCVSCRVSCVVSHLATVFSGGRDCMTMRDPMVPSRLAPMKSHGFMATTRWAAPARNRTAALAAVVASPPSM